MKNFFFTVLFLLTSLCGMSQDTIYCCTPIDTYLAPQCDLTFKDSVCYQDRKKFTGVLIVNCEGDSKSRRNNGIYQYKEGQLISSGKLKKNQKLQSGIALSITSSSERKFSGGMRKQFGGDHNETYEFNIMVNSPVRIDSIINLNKVYVPADSVASQSSNFKFTVIDVYHGSNGKYTTAAVLEKEGIKYQISNRSRNEYQSDALKIYYTLNGVQQYAVKKGYDSVEHNAAP